MEDFEKKGKPMSNNMDKPLDVLYEERKRSNWLSVKMLIVLLVLAVLALWLFTTSWWWLGLLVIPVGAFLFWVWTVDHADAHSGIVSAIQQKENPTHPVFLGFDNEPHDEE